MRETTRQRLRVFDRVVSRPISRLRTEISTVKIRGNGTANLCDVSEGYNKWDFRRDACNASLYEDAQPFSRGVPAFRRSKWRSRDRRDLETCKQQVWMRKIFFSSCMHNRHFFARKRTHFEGLREPCSFPFHFLKEWSLTRGNFSFRFSPFFSFFPSRRNFFWENGKAWKKFE